MRGTKGHENDTLPAPTLTMASCLQPADILLSAEASSHNACRWIAAVAMATQVGSTPQTRTPPTINAVNPPLPHGATLSTSRSTLWTRPP